ncbi:hypothetical protein AAY473_039776, partial [Plecturocebus cupreus]
MGFHRIGQADLKLLTLDDPPALASQSSSDSPASASQIAGITGVRHSVRLIFVVLVEMRFHHVGQAGHELLTSDILDHMKNDVYTRFFIDVLYGIAEMETI